MKIINTLSVLFFLLVAVACSSESDTIMNDIDREVESSTERVAIFNVSFMSDATQTKSSGAEDVEGGIEAIGSEASISNCFIAVLNEKDEVVASSFYYGDSFTQSDNTTTIKDRMIVKVSADELPALRFLAVTNLYSFLDGYQGTSKNLLLSCKKLQEIKDIVLVDEAPTVLVKVGISKEYSNYKTDSSNNEETQNSTSVSIPVYQRSAAIELADFKVVDSNNRKIEAKVTSLKLLNVKESAKIEGEADCNVHSSNPYTITDNKYNTTHIYAYDNTSDAKTSLEITYEVNGVPYSRTYTIKTPTGIKDNYTETVEGGKLYQLYVTVSASSSDISFVVKDWTLKNIDLGTIEGTEKK